MDIPQFTQSATVAVRLLQEHTFCGIIVPLDFRSTSFLLLISNEIQKPQSKMPPSFTKSAYRDEQKVLSNTIFTSNPYAT